jgi:HSP20 family protein
MITRYAPFERIRSLDRFGKMMDELWGAPSGPTVSWLPAFDVIESEKEVKFIADLPGMAEKDINVELQDGVLSISGARTSSKEEKKEDYVLCERSYGSFLRQFALDRSVKPDQVKAEFKEGVLTVVAPKAMTTKAQKISVLHRE